MSLKILMPSIMASLLFLCCFIAITDDQIETDADPSKCGDDAYWSLEGGVLNIYGTGPTYDLEYHPSYYDPVTPPWSSPNVIEVVIDWGITTIGDYLFWDCYNMTAISMPSTLEAIGYRAFYGCDRLTSLEIPDSVVSIEGSFGGLRIESLKLSGNLTNVDSSLIANCSKLIEVTIPETVVNLPVLDITHCDSLKSLTLPIHIMPYAEFGSVKLETFHFTKGTGYGADYEKPYPDIRLNYLFDAENIVLDDGIIRLGSKMFCWYQGSVQIPETVTILGDSCFSNCNQFTTMYLPNIQEVGNNTFSYCSNLTDVSFSNSLMSIGQDAFRNCEKLSSVYLGDNVVSIGDYAFSECYSLTEFTVPVETRSIGGSIFFAPNGGKINITTLNYNAKNATISPNSFYNIIKNVETVKFGNYVETIPDGLLKGSKIESATLPISVTTIGNEAFSDCKHLKTTSIPSNLVYLGDAAFKGTGVSSITIPSTLSYLGSEAFYGCRNLTSIEILANLTEIKEGTFSDTGLIVFKIPNTVTKLGDKAFSSCNFTTVEIPDTVTSIGSECFSACTNLESIIIPNTIDRIPDRICYQCTKLVSVTYGDGIRTIGNYAFGGCSSLSSFVVSDEITVIEPWAFCYCSSLKSFKLPDSITELYGRTFYHCDSLEQIVLSKNLVMIGIEDFAFSGLKTISLEKTNVSKIGSKAFSQCTALEYVLIPDTVVSIGQYAFDSVSKVKISSGASGFTADSFKIKAFTNEDGTEIVDLSKVPGHTYQRIDDYLSKTDDGIDGGTIITVTSVAAIGLLAAVIIAIVIRKR